MTILKAGGEDTTYTSVGSASVSTTPGLFRSGFARVACAPIAPASTSNPPPNRLNAVFDMPASIISIHANAFECEGSVASPTNATVLSAEKFRMLDPSGIPRIVIRGTGANGQLSIDTVNSAGTFANLTSTASGSYPAPTSGNPNTYDININYSSAGSVVFYINGGVAAQYPTSGTANITTDGATQIASVDLGNATSGVLATEYWSEFIAATTTTVGMAVKTLPPISAGTTQNWSGTIGDINEAVINDGAFISTNSASVQSEWAISSAALPDNFAIAAIVNEARVLAQSGGPQHFEFITVANGGASVSLPVSASVTFENYAQIQNSNPVTSEIWAIGDVVSGMQLGVESVA